MEYETRDLPLGSHEPWADNQYAPYRIEPCAMIPRDHGDPQPSMFHLLQCGHIVAIDGEDARCGINCQEDVNSTPHSIIITSSDLPPSAAVQRPNFLYCDVCQGIPWDNYRRMQPPPDQVPRSATPMFRSCRALTRREIVAAIRVPDVGVEVLLASPFAEPPYNAHNLCCGHRVWCASSRYCAQNCRRDQPCFEDGIDFLLLMRNDVIFCEECVLRAEQLYQRWEETSARRSSSFTNEHQ